MSLIRQALEGCQNCALAESQDKDNKPVQTDVTYNEGDGIKDTVIIDGPLSQVFTKALNVKLKKQPLTSEPEEKVAPLVTKPQEEQKDPLLKQNSKAPIGIATESQQQTSQEEAFIINELDKNSKEFDYIANSFDFVEKGQVPIKVTSKSTIITVGEFLKPSNLIKFTEDKKNSPVEHIVVLVADSLGRTKDTTVTSRFVTIPTSEDNFKETVFKDEEQCKEFEVVFESFIKPAGIKVALGIEQFADILTKMAKSNSYKKK